MQALAVDDNTCLSYKRREVARLTGVWHGNEPASVVKDRYAALMAVGVPDQVAARRLVGI